MPDHEHPPSDHRLTDQVARAANARWHAGALAIEAVGAAIVLWKGVPIYREFLLGETPVGDNLITEGWALVAMALINGPYWVSLGRASPAFTRSHPFLGHALQFAGRTALIFVAGLFAVVFYVRFSQLRLNVPHHLLVLGVVFSVFCFAKACDRVGESLIDKTR